MRHQIDRWVNRDRRDLSTTVPCCGALTSLNGLHDPADQGFACVALTAMNPARDWEPGALEQLEATLGLPVRVIWARI